MLVIKWKGIRLIIKPGDLTSYFTSKYPLIFAKDYLETGIDLSNRYQEAWQLARRAAFLLNVYSFHLSSTKMAPLVNKLPKLFNQLKKEVEEFIYFLEIIGKKKQ